jgi:hypothetical protein
LVSIFARARSKSKSNRNKTPLAPARKCRHVGASKVASSAQQEVPVRRKKSPGRRRSPSQGTASCQSGAPQDYRSPSLGSSNRSPSQGTETEVPARASTAKPSSQGAPAKITNAKKTIDTDYKMSKNDTGLSSKTQIEPLNDQNWETWSFLMEQYLTVNDLWDIVSGTETEPTDASKKLIFVESRNPFVPVLPSMSHHRNSAPYPSKPTRRRYGMSSSDLTDPEDSVLGWRFVVNFPE